MYKNLYNNLIDSARNSHRIKNQGIYYESHHIVPDFLFKNRSRSGQKGHLDGTPNSSENLILLTFQEHLMAHYYLYEIYKNTRYEYSAGSALQFFFIKATGSHKRQVNLSEVDQSFLKEMEYLRILGLESISKARKGTMPVVDAATRESIGSVSTTHPKVVSGEWIHHSKGKKQSWVQRDKTGGLNPNFKELTENRKLRLWECVRNSCQDGYLKLNLLTIEIKQEFNEFNRISLKWLTNNYKTINNLVIETNNMLKLDIKYDPYYRSQSQRSLASKHSKKHRWFNNGIENLKVTDVDTFIQTNTNYVPGKIKL